MTKDVIIEHMGEVMRARLPRDIDHHSAKSMREEIDRALAELMPKRLVLDFSEITFMDSSGIGLVMGRYKQLSKYSANILIANAPERVYKMMKLAGLEKIAEINKKGA